MEGIGKMKEMNGVAAEWLDRIRADVFEMLRKLEEVRHRIVAFQYDKQELRTPCVAEMAGLELELYGIVHSIADEDEDENDLKEHMKFAILKKRRLETECQKEYIKLTYEAKRSIEGMLLLDLEQVLLVISLRLCDCPKIIDSIAGEKK